MSTTLVIGASLLVIAAAVVFGFDEGMDNWLFLMLLAICGYLQAILYREDA